MARRSETKREVPASGTSEARIQPDALFRAVLDSAPDAIAVIDAGGRIVLANAQAERLFGYSAHELLGGPVDLLLPEPLRAAHVAHRATYRASPRTRPMGAGLDLVARRKDGTEFPVEISLSPVATDDGMLITAIVRDVTERKAVLARERQARREAEESLALLGTILAAVPLGIAYVGSSLRYLYLNGAFAEISGVPAAEHLGRMARELPSARGPIVEALQRRVIETGRPVLDVAIAAGAPDAPGESRQWRASGYPVSAPDGQVLGVGCFVQDVTESTRAEAEREELLAIAERARAEAERATEAERQAHGEAEAALRVLAAAERLKDDLANMVIHDLKNPVNGITMIIQLMLRKGQTLQETERSKLKQIDGTCREMMRLIQNLLEISKIEDGKMPVAREAVMLADLVAEVTQQYGRMAEDVGRRLAVAIGSEVMVVADHALLKRVLVNLVVNALRHSDSRDVEVEATPDAGCTAVTINVIDHGLGIPEDEQAHVFEKFHSRRGDPTADTGLGLPFCKLAVERMGGQIALRSTPGKTTVFSVTLPIYVAGTS